MKVAQMTGLAAVLLGAAFRDLSAACESLIAFPILLIMVSFVSFRREAFGPAQHFCFVISHRAKYRLAICIRGRAHQFINNVGS